MNVYIRNILMSLVLIIPFYGCVNSTVGMEGVMALANITAASLDTNDLLADQIVDPSARLKVKEKVMQERAKMNALVTSLMGLLEEYGKVDLPSLSQEALDLYMQYKNRSQ